MVSNKQKAERRASLRPHPARDQIVDVMRSYGKPISPTQLARITGGTLGSTAYHVRTLADAGIVRLADERRARGAVEHLYEIVPDHKDEVRLADPITQLLGLCGALTVPDPDGGYPRPAVIDDIAREGLTKIITQLCPEVQQIVAEALARAEDARRDN